MFSAPQFQAPEPAAAPSRPTEAPPRKRVFSDRDHYLNGRLSRRPRTPSLEDQSLRSLLVHRLRDGVKAVARRALQHGQWSMFCEECDQWFRLDEPAPRWTCTECGTSYTAELVVYSEVQ